MVTPIKLSSDLQRQEVINHLLSLDREDLRLRFGYAPTESIIERYVNDTWGTKTDSWFGIYHQDHEGVVGTLHTSKIKDDMAEFGFTVDKALRGQGLGDRMFKRASLWARARGIKKIFMHCLSENTVVQHIAKKNGMNVVRLNGGEAEADLILPIDYSAPLSEVLMEKMAIYDMLLINQHRLISKYFRKT